jgi:hypothetical protein
MVANLFNNMPLLLTMATSPISKTRTQFSRVTNLGVHMMVQLTLHRLDHHHTIYAVTAAVCNNDSLGSQPSHSTVTESTSCLLYFEVQR